MGWPAAGHGESGEAVADGGVSIPAAAIAQRAQGAAAYDIPAGDLQSALIAFSRQSGLQLVYPAAITRGRRTSGLQGAYAKEDALRLLIQGSGLAHRITAAGTVTLSMATGLSAETRRLGTITVDAVLEGTTTDSYNNPFSFSATRTDTPLIETPQSAQSITRQALEDAGARKVGDAYDYLAGVVKENNTGGLFGDDYIARGFGGDNILVNGNRTGTPQNLDLANVEQVEVLRGPTATLFGRSDPGGLVNVVTKQPLAERRILATATGASGLFGEGGRMKNGRIALDAGGPLDDARKLRYRLNVAAEGKRGFRQDIDEKVFIVAPVVEAELSDDTVVNVEASYQFGEDPFDRGVPFIDGQPQLDRDFNPIGPGGPTTDKHYFSTILRVDHRITGHWKARLGIHGSASFIQGEGIQVSGVSNRSITLTRRKNVIEDYFLTLQPELVGEFETGPIGHTLLMGADISAKKTHYDIRFGNASSGYDPYNPAFPTVPELTDTSAHNQALGKEAAYGFYVQDQMDLTDKIKFLAGLRFDKVRVTNDTTFVTGTTARIAEDVLEETKLLPRVGLVYRPIDEISLYGSYSETFRTPPRGRGLSDSDGNAIKPETARNKELGIKLETGDGALSGTLAAFKSDKNNVVEAETGLDFLVSRNIGKVRSEGIEFDLAGKVSENISLGVTYAYTNTFVRAGASHPEGTRLRNVPLHAASLQGSYRFTEGPFEGLRLYAGLVFEDSQKTDTSQTVRTRMPAYLKADLGADYVINDMYKASLTIRNITDREYYVSAAGQRNVAVGEPFSIGFVLTSRF